METLILDCLTAFTNLLNIRYHIILGRAGKHVSFVLNFCKEDCYHLMGLHYLTDRRDRRSRTKIYDSLISSEEYRKYISSSDSWTEELKGRVLCTKMIEQLIDDNRTVFRYNTKNYMFFSKIQAEYLLENRLNDQDIYTFLDKRAGTEERFCRSVFPKSDKDYTERQTKWTLLYKGKENIANNTIDELYKHKTYND